MSHLDHDIQPLDLLGRCRSDRIEVSIRMLDVGAESVYHPDEWQDSIIEIEAGAVEIETCDGESVEFRAGDVFWLAGFHVRALHNRGDTPAILVTATRRRTHTTNARSVPFAGPDTIETTRHTPTRKDHTCSPTTTHTAASLSPT